MRAIHLILNPFLDGMKEAGAEVELFYTRKLRINPCTVSLTAGLSMQVGAAKIEPKIEH